MNDGIRLLIVDDEEIVHKSCKKVLKSSGYTIECACSAEEGLLKISEKPFDLIVTDLKMPGMGGLELLKRVKEKDPERLVIVFTGYANVGTARESLKLGAFDYVPKPFTPDEFRDVVGNAVKKLGNKTETKMLDLMAIVAHEFKSPVSTVHTTVDTLYGGYFGKLTNEQRKGLETIMRNCQYLEDIVRSYIELSKMELDGLAPRTRNVDFVSDVLEPVLQTPEYKANLKKIRFITNYACSPRLIGDVDLLKIVLNNLVNNAIKYGKPSTDVKIEVFQEGKQAVFSIENEGVGISKEDIEKRLFKRFERLKQKGTEGVKGSGLGLYICKQIVEKHGGHIEVVSEVGRSVKFTINLNLAGPMPPVSE